MIGGFEETAGVAPSWLFGVIWARVELSVEVVAFRRMRFSELLAPSSPESVFLRFGGRSFFWDASSKGGAAGGSLGVVEGAEAAGGSARSEVMAS